MKRSVKVLVGAAAAALAFGAGGSATAQPAKKGSQAAYGECIHKGGGATNGGRWKCCMDAGGTWVEVYNPDGTLNPSKSYCEINGVPMPDGQKSEPTPPPRHTGSHTRYENTNGQVEAEPSPRPGYEGSASHYDNTQGQFEASESTPSRRGPSGSSYQYEQQP